MEEILKVITHSLGKKMTTLYMPCGSLYITVADVDNCNTTIAKINEQLIRDGVSAQLICELTMGKEYSQVGVFNISDVTVVINIDYGSLENLPQKRESRKEFQDIMSIIGTPKIHKEGNISWVDEVLFHVYHAIEHKGNIESLTYTFGGTGISLSGVGDGYDITLHTTDTLEYYFIDKLEQSLLDAGHSVRDISPQEGNSHASSKYSLIIDEERVTIDYTHYKKY